MHRTRSLIIQLLTVVVLPTALALITVAYGSVAYHENAMRELITTRDERAVRAAAETLADRFAERRLLLQVLADRLGGGATLNAILAENADLRTTFDGGMALISADGLVLASAPQMPPWLPQVRGVRATWVLDHASQTPLLLIHAESRSGAGTLYAGITLHSLHVPDVVAVMRSNADTHVYLLADDGHLLYSTDDLPVGTEWPPRTATHDPHAEEGVIASSTIPPLNWQLIVQEPWHAVVNPTLQLSLVAPLALIPAVLLAAGVLAFGLRGVVLPLRRLGQAASRLAWGDYDALHKPVGGTSEIRDLQMILRQMAGRQQQAQLGMQDYIGAMLQGQEDERRRIARELHDDTLQALIALDQQRQMAQRALERDPVKAGQHIATLQTTLAETITGLRRLIRDMRPTYIEDLGLAPALDMLVTPHRGKANPHVTFTLEGEPRRLRADHELGLYRIAQEALANALHHSGAAAVGIRLTFGSAGGIGSRVTLCISDDGRGFTLPERPNAFAQAGHYGLMGMVERAEVMGAQFCIESRPGQGTRIEVHLDVPGSSPG